MRFGAFGMANAMDRNAVYDIKDFANNMCMFGAGEVESTVKFHLKSFLKETFESFLKQPLLKETLWQEKFL